MKNRWKMDGCMDRKCMEGWMDTIIDKKMDGWMEK